MKVSSTTFLQSSRLASRLKLAVPLIAALTATSGCSVDPVDGQSIGSSWASGQTATARISIPTALAEYGVKPELFTRNAAGAKARSLVTLTSHEPFQTVWGEPYSLFTGKYKLLGTDGFAGARGRAVTLGGAGFRFSRMDSLYCLTLTENVDEYWKQCTTLDALVCTSDFAPRTANARLAGCPRTRRIEIGAGDDKLLLTPHRGAVTSSYTLANWAGKSAASVPLTLASDVPSFLELHDTDINDPSQYKRYGSNGSGGGHFVRQRKNWGNARTVSEGTAALAPSITLPALNNSERSAWWGVESMKYYDSGMCSVILPWRTVLNELVASIEPMIYEFNPPGKLPFRMYPYSRHVLTPRMSLHMPGATQGSLAYTVGISGQLEKFNVQANARVLLNVVFTLDIQNGTPNVTVSSFSLTKTDGSVLVNLAERRFGVDINAELDKIADKFKKQLPGAIKRAIGDLDLPVARTNFRPEGLELVLFDETNLSDPLFVGAALGGLCNPSTGTVNGSWGPHFDPPSREDQNLYRDTKNPDQRIRVPSNLADLATCFSGTGAPCGLMRREN